MAASDLVALPEELRSVGVEQTPDGNQRTSRYAGDSTVRAAGRNVMAHGNDKSRQDFAGSGPGTTNARLRECLGIRLARAVHPQSKLLVALMLSLT